MVAGELLHSQGSLVLLVQDHCSHNLEAAHMAQAGRHSLVVDLQILVAGLQILVAACHTSAATNLFPLLPIWQHDHETMTPDTAH